MDGKNLGGWTANALSYPNKPPVFTLTSARSPRHSPATQPAACSCHVSFRRCWNLALLAAESSQLLHPERSWALPKSGRRLLSEVFLTGRRDSSSQVLRQRAPGRAAGRRRRALAHVSKPRAWFFFPGLPGLRRSCVRLGGRKGRSCCSPDFLLLFKQAFQLCKYVFLKKFGPISLIMHELAGHLAAVSIWGANS